MVNYMFLMQHIVLMRSLAKHLRQNQFGEQEPYSFFNRSRSLFCMRAGSPWHYKIAQLSVLQRHQQVIPGAKICNQGSTDVL